MALSPFRSPVLFQCRFLSEAASLFTRSRQCFDSAAQTGAFLVLGVAYVHGALGQQTNVPTPPTTLTPTYDDDGNTLTDGTGKIYTWDCENRLTQVTLPNSEIVRYYYDGISRRIKREHITPTKTTTTTYLYDGWNVIHEPATTVETTTNPADNSTITTTTLSTKSYIWGLDLSNTLQAAGGVGGLLSIKEGETVKYHTYDGNGNVSEVLDASGAIQAHYEYDPLGNLTVSTGAWANTNVWRFSTKPFDVASGLYYYGFRCYDPASGRWPNRDPIGEIDSQNLHCFAMNNPLSWVDPLGDKITSARCEAAKNSALNRNAKGKSLMRALRNKKCHIPQISCECCEGKNSGTFDPTSKNIKICYNKSPSEDHVIETVVHELIHAYDDCNGTNWGNCNERAFSEIRAVNLSGNCRRGGYYRGKNESYEGCVKRIAALSTKEDPACGDGTAAVSAVFNRCFQSPLR